MFEGPTINTVVGDIQTSFREPHDITSFKSTWSDCFEWAIPVQQGASLLDPKIIIIDTHAGDRREIYLCPPLIWFMTDSLLMSRVVCIDIGTDVRLLWTRFQTRRDRVNWDFISGIRHGRGQVGSGRKSKYGEFILSKSSHKRVFILLFPVIKGFWGTTWLSHAARYQWCRMNLILSSSHQDF